MAEQKSNPRKKYYRTLEQQTYDNLNAKLKAGRGTSKRQAKLDGTMKSKIFSFNSYQAYYQNSLKFVKYIKENYPECTNLKKARKHIADYMNYLIEQKDENGDRLYSADSLSSYRAALNKLYEIEPGDPDYFDFSKLEEPIVRRRKDIKRSRNPKTKKIKHFSKTKNAELINFCQGTGCRENVLRKLKHEDLFSKEQMEEKIKEYETKEKLTPDEIRDLGNLKEALQYFPDREWFVHHRKDKGGKYRYAPIIGKHVDDIVERFQNTLPGQPVWRKVHDACPVHRYRADYAAQLYKEYERPIETIPYDKYHSGIKRWYQSEVYHCRATKYEDKKMTEEELSKLSEEEKEKILEKESEDPMETIKLDKRAMEIASKGLGHNRISVIAQSYLYSLGMQKEAPEIN